MWRNVWNRVERFITWKKGSKLAKFYEIGCRTRSDCLQEGWSFRAALAREPRHAGWGNDCRRQNHKAPVMMIGQIVNPHSSIQCANCLMPLRLCTESQVSALGNVSSRGRTDTRFAISGALRKMFFHKRQFKIDSIRDVWLRIIFTELTCRLYALMWTHYWILRLRLSCPYQR